MKPAVLRARLHLLAMPLLAGGLWHGTPASAQQLDAKFSCSAEVAADAQRDGDRRLLADSAEFHLQGTRVIGFHWESSLFRSTHGFECSIDDSDGLRAELLPRAGTGADAGDGWRVQLNDARAARAQRGYDSDHGINCSIRLRRSGAQLQRLQILPSCPALCGSRENFSALTVDLATGKCEYEH